MNLTKKKLYFKDVYLFIPNIIDYLRFFLLFLSTIIINFNPINCVIIYFITNILDDLDGYLAIKFKQMSKYGEIIDLTIDVISGIIFETILINIYGLEFMFLFFISLSIDLFMLSFMFNNTNIYWKKNLQNSNNFILKYCFYNEKHTYFGEILWKNQCITHIYFILIKYYPCLYNFYILFFNILFFSLVKYQYILRIKLYLENWVEIDRNDNTIDK